MASIKLPGTILGKKSTGDNTDNKYETIPKLYYIKELADLAGFLVTGTYELPAGHYIFAASIDFGAADIKLIDINGCYFFRGLCIDVTLTYSGATPFVTDSQTNQLLQWENMFVDTPNSAAFEFNEVGGNSIIIELVVFLNTGAASTISNYGFFTTKYLISILSVTGFVATDVGTVSCQVPQYNNGQNIAGTFLTVLGAASERLTISDVDSRPESNESFLDVQATYGGQVSITGGIHSQTGGDFYKTGSRDQVDPSIDANNIKNAASSVNVADGHLVGNATLTVVNIVDTPTKVNAVWTDILEARFSFNTNGTWTYIGTEDITVDVSILATIDASGGGTKTMSIYAAKNGSVVSSTQGRGSGSSEAQIASIGLLSLVTGDTVEVFVENNTDGASLTVTTATLLIRG